MAWTALLDACVLFPVATRDLLLRGAVAGVYQVRWSPQIIAEVRASLIGEAACSAEQADHLVEMMTAAFPEALVDGHEELVVRMLNELGDRHVLAAALVAKVDVIVTDNIRHFPPESYEPLGIELQTADEFLTAAFDLAPQVMAAAFLQQVNDFRRPSLSPAHALSRLESRLPSLARRLLTIDAVREAAHLRRLQQASGVLHRPGHHKGRGPLRSTQPPRVHVAHPQAARVAVGRPRVAATG